MLLAGAAGSMHALYQREVLVVRRDAQQIQHERLQRRVHRAAVAGPASGSARANSPAEDRLLLVLARPWEQMLDEMLKASGSGVVLTRLQPSAEGGRTLLLSGRAESSAAFLAYVGRLRESGAWQEVTPLSEAREAGNAAEARYPVAFQLLAVWGGEQ